MSCSLPRNPAVIHLVIQAAGFQSKAELTLAMMSFDWEITSLNVEKFLQ